MFSQVLIPMLIGPWIGAVSVSGNFDYNMENVLYPAGYTYTIHPSKRIPKEGRMVFLKWKRS